MDSKQRFVVVFAAVTMLPYSILVFVGTNDLGVYLSIFAVTYFAVKLAFSPKMRTRVDVLAVLLLVLFAYFAVQSMVSILYGGPV